MSRRLIEKADALLSREKGTIRKDHGGRIRICLVYANTYPVGMSNLGFQGIYGLLNRRDDVVCERAFLPEEGDFEEHRRTRTPLFSLESKTPLGEFDIAAFSISFENDYPNVLKILDLAKVPFRSRERNPYHPLVVAGGVFAFFNPEPLAPVFDVIFIGEAEESLEEFLDVYKGVRERGDSPVYRKPAVKKSSLSIEGVYLPEYYSVAYNADGTIAGRTPLHGAPVSIRRRYLKDFSRSPLTTAVVTPDSEFSSMYLIEIMRGCPWSCRFCLVGHIYNPLRKKDPAAVSAEIGAAGELSRKVGLIGPSLSDYPRIQEILCMEGVSFSLTSLRASERSADLVHFLKGSRSVSIAPEAGTERMRRVIDKKVTEEDILSTSALLFEAGIETLRLYFMIGLPSETDEDISGIAALVKKIREISPKGGIVLSVSTFVPKPFTPFQWHPMAPLSEVKGKLKRIKKELQEVRGVKVLHDVPKYAHMQGLFARGDRRIFKVLEAMVTTDEWGEACSAAGVDRDFYLFRERSAGENLPWDFIDTGSGKDGLWREYREALAESLLSPPKPLP
ncbi:MAG: radical SAM protein [Nitrospirales bacterium]|nr:radical SAM protein [Nitrospirales bacterium]